MPRDVKRPFMRSAELYGAHVELVDGVITDAGRIAAERGGPLGWYDVSTLKEPYRLEGKKTMAFELAEQLDWRWPDWIIYPTGGGTGLIGMWKAFEELETHRLGAARPSSPHGVGPGRRLCADRPRVSSRGRPRGALPSNPHTFADGLRVPKAVGDFLMLRAIRESGGTAIAVSDRRDGGRDAAAWPPRRHQRGAGRRRRAFRARRARRRRSDRPDDVVVLFNTGGALKYLDVLKSIGP